MQRRASNLLFGIADDALSRHLRFLVWAYPTSRARSNNPRFPQKDERPSYLHHHVPKRARSTKGKSGSTATRTHRWCSSGTPLEGEISTRFPTPRRTRSVLRRSQEMESPDSPGRFKV